MLPGGAVREQPPTHRHGFEPLHQRACVQPWKGVVQQQEIRTSYIDPPGQLVKKVQCALSTLQHLQDERHLRSMEHPSDAIHIRRVILHHSNKKRRGGLCGLHTSDCLVLAIQLISMRLPDALLTEVKQPATKQEVPYQQLIQPYSRQR